MERTRHQEAKDLFLRAGTLAPGERPAFLDDACAGDAALRAEVESLLAHDERAEGFLEEGADAYVRGMHPETIGPYRILGPIGEGGMGTVYRAEQASPKRLVALKVVRAGVVTPESLRRFENEVEFLGRLEHPGIARIYEAGRTSQDLGERPYFAMELVSGRPLTECALDRQGKLALLLEVCAAVAHAHGRGIVHRDLKPANILVSADGKPKILDFGIALAVDANQSTLGLTQTGLLLGTVQYMSPEQALAVPGEVDARADVYSLGVIGYELLSGTVPYEVSASNPLEALRVIREVEPKPLGDVDASLRGDLETIFQTALEKERTRRYASIVDFAADIRRSLEGTPILARPAGLWDRFGKWLRRNRTLAIAIGVALTGPVFAFLGQAVPAYAALVLGLVGTSIGLVRSMRLRREAEEERRAARREADKAKAINTFLQEMLASAQPGEQGHDVKVVDVLDRAAERIGDAFRSQPEIEGPIRMTLGLSYRGLGQYDRSLEQLELARDLCTRALGPGHVDSLNALGWTAIVMCEQGRHADAEPLQRRLIELRREFLGPDDPETIMSTGQMSLVLRGVGKKEEAIANQRAVVDAMVRTRGTDDPQTATARGTLGSLLGNNEQYEEAEEVLRTAIQRMRESVHPGHHNMLAVQSNFATVLHANSKLEEAEAAYRECIERQSEAQGADHPLTSLVFSQLARLLSETDRTEEAEPMLRRSREILTTCFGPKHPYAAQATTTLGELLRKTGRATEAEPILAEGAEHSVGRRKHAAQLYYGLCLAELERDGARSVLEGARRGVVEAYDEDHPLIPLADEALAQLPS